MRHAIIEFTEQELEEIRKNAKTVTIKRVTKVVKGGRRMRFAALIVVGDGKGHVGAG